MTTTRTNAKAVDAAGLGTIAYASAAAALETVASSSRGITDDEAARRRTSVGRNDIAHEKPPAWYAQLGHAFMVPFNVVLAVLCAISAATGDQEAALIIGIMVALSTGLRFVQEYRSNQSAESLRAMVKTRATVERDGDAFTPGVTPATRRREIPMDELVPGDVIYLSAGDMIPADVRILSAKDLFVSQSALTGEALPVEKMDTAPAPARPPSAPDLPTICLMGTSVVSGTAMGVVVTTGSKTIVGSMARGLVGQRVTTAFDIGVGKVSWLLIRFMLVMVPVVVLVNGLTKGNWLEAVLFGLAVAVGLTPEMLPMIVTTNLAKGAVTMARRKTIVKRLNAIQNFGAMDILCTDKTGTLTQDKVVLERHVNVVGEEDDSVLALAFLNSYYQTGLKNLLDVAVLEHGEIHRELEIDKAYGKVDEIPFDFTRRRMSVVLDHEHTHHQLVCKGAVEEMLAVSKFARDEERIIPLDTAHIEDARTLVAEMSEDGFRVVAVAYREFQTRTSAYTVADESELILAGFIGFLDPPKESAAPALAALRANGVTVKILTGDNELVSRKVCRDVGLDPGTIITGSDIAGLDDAALGVIADASTVFARLAPDDKVRIVRALKARGHTVGFMGDGINDAGALRQADVGISVDTAVDVAKESADIILLEKSLMILEEGVIEGRKTFGNTIKYIKMAASSNFGNVFSVLAASAFLPFLPMLPVQMLVQNLLYDISQTAIPFDAMDAEYLATPRQWRADDIGRFMLYIGPISSIFDILTFLVLWHIFGADAPEHAPFFQAGWFMEGLLSQSLIVHMIRTAKVPFVQSRATWPVLIMTALVMGAGLAIPYSAFGRSLGFEAPPVTYLIFLAMILVAYTALTQMVKTWYIRRFATWL